MKNILCNPMMDILRAGGISVGVQLRSRSPLIAEMLGLLGCDFVYVETEHFACDSETLEDLFRAISYSGATPLVRRLCNNPEELAQMLDMGAMGVIIPHVDDAEQARAFVEACRFPPLGCRGSSSTSRAAGYGILSSSEYKTLANKNTCVIAMIESANALENIDAILHSGIDMIRIGFNDLAQDLGVRQDEPLFKQSVERILTSARASGIPVGTSIHAPEEAADTVSQGFRQLRYESDLSLLKNILKKDLARVRTLCSH